MAGQLTVRVQRGDAVFELQGDADAVQAALASLGEFLATFSLPGPSPVGGTVQPGPAPGPTTTLTNPAGSSRFVFDSLSLPTLPGQGVADDVNGDGRPDNQFANIMAAIASQGIDFQGGINAELQADHIVLLVTLATELATPSADQRAAVTLLGGKPLQRASRTYVVDASVPPVTLQGRIVGGRFVSDNPRTGGALVERDIPIPLGPAVGASLPVQGLRMAFDVARDGHAISNGQLTGSVKQANVQDQLIPALAMIMTQLIQSAPASPVATSVRQLFDTGGCTNPNGTAAQAGDGVIDVCELATNPLLTSLLQPDVQIFDAQGNYAPNPLGGNADSISVGIGFSAVAASY